MDWMRDNWDKVLNGFVLLFGAGGIATFFTDFMAMCRERPWQAIFLAAVCLAAGYSLGLCNRPAAKAARERRRTDRERERGRREARERMFETIGRMNVVRKALMLSAIADGSVDSSPATVAQAMTLHKEGYLNAAGTNERHDMVFTPHTWMVDMANDGGEWERKFDEWVEEVEKIVGDD